MTSWKFGDVLRLKKSYRYQRDFPDNRVMYLGAGKVVLEDRWVDSISLAGTGYTFTRPTLVSIADECWEKIDDERD